MLKRILVTMVCAFLSRIANSQVVFPSDTITMYTKDEKLYLDTIVADTLYARNESGRFQEQALELITEDSKVVDTLSMCPNRSTPKGIKLIRIGDNYFRVGNRFIVKMDEQTLKAFARSFDYMRHCDHMSHASHFSHTSHFSSI